MLNLNNRLKMTYGTNLAVSNPKKSLNRDTTHYDSSLNRLMSRGKGLVSTDISGLIILE